MHAREHCVYDVLARVVVADDLLPRPHVLDRNVHPLVAQLVRVRGKLPLVCVCVEFVYVCVYARVCVKVRDA